MRPRLLLLGGQTLALGLTMAFLVVPSSSVFLATYGAQALPYVYLCVAAAGVAVSALMARAQRRWSLAHVTVSVLGIYVLLVAAAWVGLTVADAAWVTFPLVVLFPLAIPVGFVLIGTQAGRLLDVRQMKAYFPRVVAGFSVGFAIGGLAAARLVKPMGGPANLLTIDVVTALLFLGLAAMTARRYPAELAAPPPPRRANDPAEHPDLHPTARNLFRNPLVVLIFGYQVLSAAVTQLLDFLVWERAAERYPDPSDLARFLGIFGAVINIISVAFVVLVAGRLLTRYGIRLGLAANPVGVLVLVVTCAAVGYAAGPASTAFFLLVCAQQVTDIALTDGTTRTSVNAIYQALPATQRVAAQTWVEGVGFPMALGFVGVLLIVANALHLTVVPIVVITAVLTVAWLLLAFAAYSGYGANLRRTLTRRSWDPVALRLDDDSRAVVEHLTDSTDLRDVRLGLDLLADSDDPSLAPRVSHLLVDPDPARRSVGVSAAAHAYRTAVDHSWVRPALVPLAADPDDSVRTAAQIVLVVSGTAADREAATRRWVDELTGDDPVLRTSALAAAAAAPDPAFAPALLELAHAHVAPAALADALAANAEALSPATDEALSAASPQSRQAIRRLVGALSEGGSPTARATLLRHLDHRDPEVADAVLAALVAGGPAPVAARHGIRATLHSAAERTARVLAARVALDSIAATDTLSRGLRDEEARIRHRAIALVGLLHEPTSVARTVRMLEPLGGNRPLAMETLEVTVGRAAYPLVLALVDPSLHDASRRESLAHVVSVPQIPDAPSALTDIVDDPDGFWHDTWLRACALHALADVAPQEARTRAGGLIADEDRVMAQTAVWVVESTAASLT